MKGGHICKTRAGKLHFRVGVTVVMPGRVFKMNNTVCYNIFPVWVCRENRVVVSCFKVIKNIKFL